MASVGTSLPVRRTSHRFIEPAVNTLDPCIPAIFEGVIDIDYGKVKVNVTAYKYKHTLVSESEY